jgi:hypothetical protein
MVQFCTVHIFGKRDPGDERPFGGCHFEFPSNRGTRQQSRRDGQTSSLVHLPEASPQFREEGDVVDRCKEGLHSIAAAKKARLV